MSRAPADNTEDPSFTALPRRIRQLIDRAFDSATRNDGPSLKNQREIAEHNSNGDQPGGFIAEPQGGGFIPDEEQSGGFFLDDQGGGYIPDEPNDKIIADDLDITIANDRDSSADENVSHISLAAIPTALQLLDLPPDDEQVLAVFKNAATGWTNSRSRSSRDDAGDTELVSRRDWRAVCAVLLAPQQAEDEEANDSDEAMNSGEEYVGSDEDDSVSGENEMEDEDYMETQAKTKSRRSRGRSHKTIDEDTLSNRLITARQKEASREAFALFFPDISESQLDAQQITVSDLVRVSKELKEKLTYDQIMEMLSTTSTSDDKSSVSLSDFEKMMVETKMA